MNKLKSGTMCAIIILFFPSLSSAAPSSGLDLSDSINLLAICTPLKPEDNPFYDSTTPIGKLKAEQAYAMNTTMCGAYIAGVIATLKYTKKSSFCFSDRTVLKDAIDVAIVRLKQKYKGGVSSITIIIEALTMNWPCKP